MMFMSLPCVSVCDLLLLPIHYILPDLVLMGGWVSQDGEEDGFGHHKCHIISSHFPIHHISRWLTTTVLCHRLHPCPYIWLLQSNFPHECGSKLVAPHTKYQHKVNLSQYTLNTQSTLCNSPLLGILTFYNFGRLVNLYLNRAITHSLKSSIRPNFWHCTRWPWTIFQSRQCLSCASGFFHQQRRLIPWSETGSARFSWRPFNCTNFCSRRNA